MNSNKSLHVCSGRRSGKPNGDNFFEGKGLKCLTVEEKSPDAHENRKLAGHVAEDSTDVVMLLSIDGFGQIVGAR